MKLAAATGLEPAELLARSCMVPEWLVLKLNGFVVKVVQVVPPSIEYSLVTVAAVPSAALLHVTVTRSPSLVQETDVNEAGKVMKSPGMTLEFADALVAQVP